MRVKQLDVVFVDSAPDELMEGVFYISIPFRTTLHLCACGCRNQVVLPLRPTAWKMTYDGDTVSMSPSIGNWSFPCRSHYWIRHNRVDRAETWSDDQVAAGRRRTLEERGVNPDREATEPPTRRSRGLFTQIGRILSHRRTRT